MQTRRGIDATVLIAFLSAISVVYLLYLVSQLAYFFSAFSGLLPSDFTVAQYARRGFFEMALLCLINLGIVMFVLWAAHREGDKEPRSIRLFALFLCVFSLVLLATALSKMFLYIDSFGMTHLRILTSVFMVFLAVVLCTVALWLFVRRIPYLKVACITAALLIVVTGFADLDRMVASYNVNAYLSGELDTIDMLELSVLSSDSAVPYVWELTDDADAEVAARAYRILLDKLIEHDLVDRDRGYGPYYPIEASYDWRSYNLLEYEAFCLLQEHAQEILDNVQG